MIMKKDKYLVSVDWLKEHLNDPDLIVLDSSLGKNMEGVDPELAGQVIVGARYFDLKNGFSDTSSDFPNTFPSEEKFEESARKLGINNTSTIVVYDNLGIYTSPRVWWMFKRMGHENIFVLDGGLPEWCRKGYETTKEYSIAGKTGDYKAKLDGDPVKDISFVKQNISDQKMLLIDARSKGRFDGTAEEPRKGLRSGHIPGSVNIPFKSLLKDGKYKSKEELKAIFDQVGADDRPLLFSCGSGVTACVLLLASEMVQDNPTAVYDGSWTEWATKEI